MNEQSSKFENPAELEQIISAWNQHVNETDWQTVIEGMSPDMGEDGSKIYEWSAEGFKGDAAIVDMRDVKVTGAEYHIGETELHLPISGSARMWVDGEEKEIIPGQVIAVEPETPHFIIPNKDYVVAVVSLPSFNPENLIPIEAETQLPENMKFDTKYHLGLVAAAGWSKSESE